MSDVTYLGNVDRTLDARRERRELRRLLDQPEPRSLMDITREASELPVGHPRRAFLLRESARVVRERQLDVPYASRPDDDGPEAAA